MAERIELEISTQGMRAGAEEAKALLESIPKAAGKAAKDADAEMKRAIASAKSLADAQERASASLKQQTAVYQQQAAIQKQVLSGTLSLAQGEKQLAQARQQATAATEAEKTGNAALAAQYAKSRAEVAANTQAIKAAQQAQAQAGREAQALAKQTAAEERTAAAIRVKAAQDVERQARQAQQAQAKAAQEAQRLASAEATARQKQASALDKTRVAAVQQNTVLQRQIAIQKQVLAGTLSLAQGEEQLAAASINAKVKNDALSSSLAKSKTEYAANAAALKAMKAPVEENVSAFGRLASGATLLKGALVGGVVLAAASQLKTMTLNAFAAADAIDDLASQLNLSTDALQEWQFVFEQGGSSAEAFASGFQLLQKNVGDAAAGIGRAREVLKVLKLDAQDFAKALAADPTKALETLADRIAGIKNPAQQAAVVMRLMGDPSWVNVMKQGGDAASVVRQKLHELGGVMGGETVKAGADLENQVNALSKILSTQLSIALISLGPLLMNVVGWFAQATGALGKFIDETFRLSTATKQARLTALNTEIAATTKELEGATAAMLSQSIASEGNAVRVVDLTQELSDLKKEQALVNGELVTMNVQAGSSTTATNNQAAAMLNMAKATKAAKTETDHTTEALAKSRAEMIADTAILSAQADIYQDVIDGKIGLSDATAKAAAVDRGAKVDSDAITQAYEKQAKRLADNKTAVEETNKAIEELIKRNSELKKSIDETTQSFEEEARIQQVGLTVLKASVAAGKTLEQAHKDAARAIELTTVWLKEYHDKMSKGMDEAGARQFANEMVALKEKTLDLADAADKFDKAYEQAMDSAILKTSDLRSMFNEVIDDILSGGKNLLDKFKEFGRRMGVKLIEGIAFGKKGLEDQVLIPNFSQLFGQNGIIGTIFQTGGQSAGGSFISGFMSLFSGGKDFSNVTGGSSSTAGIFDGVISGSSTAGTQAGSAFSSGFMTSVGAGLAGGAVGMGIGSWANKKLGIGQTKQGKMGGMIGGAAGGIAGGVGAGALLGAEFGSIVGPLGTLIGAAIGAIIGTIAGGALGNLFAPGRIAQEKMRLTKFYEKVFDGLNFKQMSEKAVAKGLVDYDQIRDAGETLGVIFADSMGKGATQGTIIRFPGQLFANFRKMGLSVEEAKEKVLELAEAMGVDFASSIETVNMAMNKAASGPTLLGLDITKEEIKEARKNLKEYGDTSTMTIAELDALALANGNVGSTIITLNQLYAGAVDLQTGFADHAAAVAGVNGLLADKFKEVATAGGMAEETLTALSEQVRNGTLSVEEALIAYNRWAESAGKTKLALEDVALDAEAFDPLTGSIKEANATLEELIGQLQEVDQLLVQLAERQINIQAGLMGNLKDIGAISPLEELTGRRDAAYAALERSRAAVAPRRVGTNPVTGEREGGAPTTEQRLQLANDLAAYRAILVEDYNLRKAAIEQGRQDQLAAITAWEQTATKEVQARYAGQRQALQEQIDAARAEGQAAIDAAREQGQALVEAARKQGQAEIEAARKQGQAEVEAARKQGQDEIAAARTAGQALIKAVEDRAKAEMEAVEKEKELFVEASDLRIAAVEKEIDLLTQWRDLAGALGEQIHALITAAESPLSSQEQFGAIQRETERARQRLAGASGAERIPAIQDLARLLGEQLSASPFQRLDPRQRELFSTLTQELTRLQREAGREGAPLEDKQAQLVYLQAQSTDMLKSIDAQIEAARVAQDLARDAAEQQAAALEAAAEAAAEARNKAAEAAADARNEAAQAHAEQMAEAAQAQAEQLVAQAEAAAAARQKELQDQMDALSVAEQAELAAVTEKATAERNAVNLAADQHQADLQTEYTNLLKALAKEESDQITALEGEAQAKRQALLDKISELVTNSEELNTYNKSQGEVMGRLVTVLEALNTFLNGIEKAQGGMYDPKLSSNRLILAHRGETVAIGQPTRGLQTTNGPSVSIGAITINGTSSTTKADVKAMVEEAVVQSIRPNGQGRAELKRQGVQFK